MKLKMTVKMALIGALLIGGSAATAADNQADWITTLSVKLALLNKLGTDSLHVDVDSNAGALTLAGTVEKRETRELAATIATSVDGVKSVDNQLRLEASVANPSKTGVAAGEAEAEVKDAVLATKIRLALVNKMGSDGFKIGTEVANGVVTLKFDPDFAAARRAEAGTIVNGVDGVTKVVSVEKICSVKCDIFSPNSLGAVLNEKSIAQLRCAAVVGAANNQLATETDAKRLMSRGILYTPDFVVNAGGLINVSDEIHGYNPERAASRVDRIYDNGLRVLHAAHERNMSPHHAAVELAEERVTSIGALRLFRRCGDDRA